MALDYTPEEPVIDASGWRLAARRAEEHGLYVEAIEYLAHADRLAAQNTEEH